MLRQYEIPFLATPGVPGDRQIPLSDLTLSLRSERIVLRSQRLGCEVLPRLTTAHDFTATSCLKIYKFLGLLQHQSVTAWLSWDWGALDRMEMLPRVVFGNIVLAPARWSIDESCGQWLSQEPNEQRMRRMEEWRQARHVPRLAAIEETDNQILLDFENPVSVEICLEHISKHSHTTLVEMFPAPGNLPARGPEGDFVHEVLLPFIRRRSGATAPPLAPIAAGSSVSVSAAEGSRIPTSDWLFAKLYCSPSHADRVLHELVKPLVKEVLASGATDRWFFVRYADPNWHLRLRLHGDPAVLRERVLPELRQSAEEQQRRGTLWRLAFDQYEPEVDRYGGPDGVLVAERLFQIDSEVCLDLIGLTTGDEGSQRRWQLALCVADLVLSALGLSPGEKNTVARAMAKALGQDFLIDLPCKLQIAQKIREHRSTVGLLLHQAGAGPVNQNPHAAGTAAFFPEEVMTALWRCSAQLQQIRIQLRELREAGKLSKSIPELATSFVHMSLNRFLRSRHQEQEYMVYELLGRAYASAHAQSEIQA